jgi:hypothetical protein
MGLTVNFKVDLDDGIDVGTAEADGSEVGCFVGSFVDD